MIRLLNEYDFSHFAQVETAENTLAMMHLGGILLSEEHPVILRTASDLILETLNCIE